MNKDKISIVAISYGRPCPISELFIKSIQLNSTGLIDKVVLMHNFEKEYWEKETKYKDLKILEVGRPPMDKHRFHERAMATHEAIKYVDSKYLLISDADIVYTHKGFDRFYIDTYETYDLTISGCNHFLRAPYGPHFPCVINMFISMDKVPPPDWMKGELTLFGMNLDGQWLVYNKMQKYVPEFPGPTNVWWDTGSYVWLWVKQNKGRYLTLLHTHLGTVYNLGNYTQNFEIDPSLIKDLGKNQDFLRHAQRQTFGHRRKRPAKLIAIEKMQAWYNEYMPKAIKLL